MPSVTPAATFAASPPARPRVLTLRVSETELTYLDALAQTHGLSRSEAIRALFAGRIIATDAPAPAGPTTDVEVGR